MAKKQKIQHRIRVNFEGDIAAVDAILCAMTGQGYLVSMQESNLSYGEVSYRMGLARKAYGLQKGVGFARLYHQGKTPLAKQIREEMFPALRAVVMETMVAFRKHPTPKVADRRR